MHPIHSITRSLVQIALVALVFGGCAQWKQVASLDQSDSSTASSGDPARDPRQRVVVEVEFVNASLDAMDADQKAGLW